MSVEDAAGSTKQQLLERIAVKLRDSGYAGDAFNASADLLGKKTLPDLTGVLDTVATVGMQGMIDKAKEAGDVMGGDLIDRLDNANAALERLQSRVTIFFGELVQGLAVFGTAMGKWVTNGGKWNEAWADAGEKFDVTGAQAKEKQEARIKARVDAQRASKEAPEGKKKEREVTTRAFNFGNDSASRFGAVLGNVPSSGMMAAVNKQAQQLAAIAANTRETATTVKAIQQENADE
jgi:hypothetical protein